MTMTFIASLVPTVGAGSVQFTNIPQTFTHLQLRYFIRGSDSGSIAFANIYVNGNAYTTDYSNHSVGGDGASAYSTAVANGGGVSNLYAPGASTTANCFAVGLADVLDYTNTNKYKTIRVLHGWDANGSGYAILASGMLKSTTAAITSIGLFNMTFVANCRIDLYGIGVSAQTGA